MNNLILSLLLACGPFFPISYFPYENCSFGEEGSTKEYYYAYAVREHFGTELAIIGDHYYKDWIGKAPKSNKISADKADELDFFAAGEKAGVDKEVIEKEWAKFVDFKENVCKRFEAGEKVELPRNLAKFTKEFYLYKLGHAEWLVFRRDEDPAPFTELLKLPKAERLYRTTWVHFVRLANATKHSQKDVHLAALRKALDEGYKDTAGLEAYVLRFLNSTCGLRYAPLVLASYQGVSEKEWPLFLKRIFMRNRSGIEFEEEELKKLCEDQVGVEVAIACGFGAALPDSAAKLKTPALEADRQAWILFEKGDIESSRKVVKLASEDSLIRLFLESRFARLEGDYKTSGEKLSRWLEVYKVKGTKVVGYGIDSSDAYWTGKMCEEKDLWGCFGAPYYIGKFCVDDEFYGNYNCMFMPKEIEEASNPTLSRVVAGELGLVKVLTRDLEEALYAFIQSRNWLDVAFVAEKCLTIDELIKVMRSANISSGDKELLSNLLMRRLMRVGRTKEALEWAPEKMKPLIKEYIELVGLTTNKKYDADTRAVAYFNLSRLVATRGMEIMGTELRPDNSMERGLYKYDGMPISEPKEFAKLLNVNEELWKTWKAPSDRVTARFHYRYKATEFARSAVNLAKDKDVKAWSLMLGGVITLSLNDTKSADWFYKKLKRMNHPRAKVGAWFDKTYIAFREKYYNEERHLKPMRVPPRFTLETFKTLDFGK